MFKRSDWPLGRLVVLVLAGAFAMLLVEVRALHQDVLHEHAIAWAPIVYCGAMLAAAVAGLALWDRGGRRILFWAFAPALVVGPVGWWLHNDGRPLRGVGRELAAWTRPVGRPAEERGRPGSAQRHEHEHEHEAVAGPPALAPLALAGLGALGMLACARRSQPPPPAQ